MNESVTLESENPCIKLVVTDCQDCILIGTNHPIAAELNEKRYPHVNALLRQLPQAMALDDAAHAEH